MGHHTPNKPDMKSCILLAFITLYACHASPLLRANTEQNIKNLLNAAVRKSQQKLNQQGLSVNIRDQLDKAQTVVQPQMNSIESVRQNTLSKAQSVQKPYNSKTLFDLLDLGASIIGNHVDDLEDGSNDELVSAIRDLVAGGNNIAKELLRQGASYDGDTVQQLQGKVEREAVKAMNSKVL